MSIVAIRTDEKLVHGKIINDWCEILKPTNLLIVDDNLSKDTFMSNVFISLSPSVLDTTVCSVNDVINYLKKNDSDDKRIFILCKTPATAYEVYKKGIKYNLLTIADKKYISKRIEITKENINAINELIKLGVNIYYQKFPDVESVKIENL